MSLFYSDPFSDLLNMQRMMNRFIGGAGLTPDLVSPDLPLLTGTVGIPSTDLTTTTGGVGGVGGALQQWNPRVDVRDTNQAVILHAELPGCNKEDIKLSIDHENNRLVLQGHKRTKERKEGENWVRKERFEGHFYRALPLPRGIDLNKIQANYNNGVLEVDIPKVEGSKQRQFIDIKTTEGGQQQQQQVEQGKGQEKGGKVPIGGEKTQKQ